MKKLHFYAFSALAASALTFSASSVMALSPTNLDFDRSMRITQSNQGIVQNTTGAMKGEISKHQSQSRRQYRGHISAAPVNGTYASKMIGTEVSIADGETAQ